MSQKIISKLSEKDSEEVMKQQEQLDVKKKKEKHIGMLIEMEKSRTKQDSVERDDCEVSMPVLDDQAQMLSCASGERDESKCCCCAVGGGEERKAACSVPNGAAVGGAGEAAAGEECGWRSIFFGFPPGNVQFVELFHEPIEWQRKGEGINVFSCITTISFFNTTQTGSE
ncbi:uncharacterized protein MONOS_10894 [Monocercomonoides exilis]|uniref:uncharacterized protein n=1 Tax=Monocercomonoides exilis TaxID=2049356 RepID=UPI00355ACC07|nr:hypothetical protein MONOS_10894 [Monocercomonoides exilis]|eukprot:MONOS_10894.1-p1 / transcript=MONOS_10894.1 / gene=MONOS_10894 / organism=Monocercomonoides_exilis_PA203 / gene_product=unspecified product / transcript_product=unspecified product / location=Mono_scaffold00516:2532-3200(-) / protein_length=170 / sequence_SO=supercontig / SO=protein_coding / is_pseudo=false